MDEKLGYILQGMGIIERGLDVARDDARTTVLERRGMVKAIDAARVRLVAEIAALGADVRAKADKGEIAGDELAHLKGRIKGIEHAARALGEMHALNLREQQVAEGRLEAIAQIAKKIEEQAAAEKAKAERRERAAEEDPEGTRPDGSPAPVGGESVRNEQAEE